MELPRIAAVATATPAQRFTQAELLAHGRLPGRAPPRILRGQRHRWPASLHRPASASVPTSRWTSSTTGSGAAPSSSARPRCARALDRAGWRRRRRGLPRHHDVHGPDDAEPRRPPGGSSRLPPRRAARARRRHRLRRRGGRAAAGLESHRARSPVTARSCSPSRSARPPTSSTIGWRARWPTPSSPTAPGHWRSSGTAAGPPSWSTAPCSAPSTSTRWASSIRAGGRAWSCPRTCGASAPP